MKLEDVQVEMKKISFAETDWLVLHVPVGLSGVEMGSIYNSLDGAIKSLPFAPFVVILPAGYELEKLSDEDLQRMGICRADRPAIVEAKP